MEFDELLNELGGFGRYQKRLSVVLFLLCIPSAFYNMSIVFLSSAPEHWCRIPALETFNLSLVDKQNISLPLEKDNYGKLGFSKCRMYDHNYTWWTAEDVEMALATVNRSQWTTTSCQHGWYYDDSQIKSSIVTEWDIVCEKRLLQATAASVYMAGLMVGAIVLGSVSDILGRKPSICCSLVLQTVCAVCVAFSPNYVVFVAIRFFLAVFSTGLFMTVFVLDVELVPTNWRVHSAMLTMYGWVAGYMILAGLAYFVRDWFKLQLLTAVPSMLLWMTMCVLPESPRWLYNKGKRTRADEIIRSVAKINKREVSEKLQVAFKSRTKAFIWDMLRTSRLRLRSVRVFFLWWVNSLVYLGLSLNASKLGGNSYVNFFVAGVVEIPAYLLVQVSLTLLGRRLPLSGTLCVSGTALLATLAVPDGMNWLLITLATVGKFATSASYAMMYVFTSELYPTNMRNVALGTSNFWARIGAVLAPYIAQLSDFSVSIPLVIFGTLSLTAGLVAFTLPETRDEVLLETLEDGENFGRDSRTFGCLRRSGTRKTFREQDAGGVATTSI